MDLPSWLSPSNDPPPSDTKSDVGAGTAPTSTRSASSQGTTTEVEPVTSTRSNNNSSGGGWIRFMCRTGISMILLAAFIYSIFANRDDADALQWYIYYAAMAVVPVAYLMYSLCPSVIPDRFLQTICGAAAIYSAVYVVLTAIWLSRDKMNTELHWEMAGVGVGFLSSLYHSVLVCCTPNGNKNNDTTSDEFA